MTSASRSGKATLIKVDYLARVEGEASLHIKIQGDRVQEVRFKVFEPPRMFEALLRGRHFTEAPDITARICGICPIAYQMSSVHAMERALHIQIHPMVRLLRRLFYCGEWIESHALHVFMLHAPDFLGYDDVIQMARDHRPTVELALRLKKIGNHLVSTIGGREIHPVSAAVGGFHRCPARAELEQLREDLKWALDASLAAVKVSAGFEFPDFEQNYEYVALRHPDEYPFCEGRLVSNKGLDIDPAEYEDHFIENHVKHSNALHSQLRDRGAYHVGPLARFNLNYDRLPAVARQAAADVGLSVPCMNPFKSIVVRAVEMVFACDEALRILEEYETPPEPRAPMTVRAATGHAITEAPRGILYHRYSIDATGQIIAARIVPPTAQNQKQMEDDLWRLAPKIINRPLSEVTWKCEQAVRNYDPCISCATHFLRVNVERVD